MPDTPQPSPIPPRFWWLKRLAVAVPLVLLGVLTLRLIWGHRANQRLEATVQAIAARGEPIRFEDMVITPVPDKDNKAYYLEQALANWPTVPGQNVRITDTDWHLRDPNDPNAPPDPITDSQAYLDQCGPIFDLLRQAEQAPSVDWRLPMQSPVIRSFLATNHYGPMRQLSWLIRDAAERTHALGDDARMFQAIGHVNTIAATNDAPPSFLIGHLVAISIRHLAYSGMLEPLLPTTTIDAASRTQAERLLQTLLDERPLRQGFVDAWTSERWFSADTCNALQDGRLDLYSIILLHYGNSIQNAGLKHHLTMAFFKPCVVNDITLILVHQTASLEAARRFESYPAFKAYLQANQPSLRNALDEQRYLHPLSGTFLPHLESINRTHFLSLTNQRLAATALAIKLYEADFGNRPATLDELVPEYLPAVPLDPLADDGSTIRYKPEGATLVPWDQQWQAENGHPITPLPERGVAIVYSVGPDHTDDAGRIYVNTDGTYDTSTNFREFTDLIFLLDPEPRPEPKPAAPDDAGNGLEPLPDGGFIY